MEDTIIIIKPAIIIQIFFQNKMFNKLIIKAGNTPSPNDKPSHEIASAFPLFLLNIFAIDVLDV